MQLHSFLLIDPQGPIPWTQTISIHSGNLLQPSPLNQLELQNPGKQVSSQPIQNRWRRPSAPMPRLASNQTVSSETQIPSTDHQGPDTKHSIHRKTSICTFCQSSTMSFLSVCNTETEKTLEAQKLVHNPSSNFFPPHAFLVPTTPLLPASCLQLIKGVNGLQEVENQNRAKNLAKQQEN